MVEAARQAIADNKAPGEARRGDRVWQLSGVAVCRHCGRNMVANSGRKNKGRKFWYRCPTRRDDKDACAHATHHQAPELEEAAWARMQLLLHEPERARRAYEAARGAARGSTTPSGRLGAWRTSSPGWTAGGAATRTSPPTA